MNLSDILAHVQSLSTGVWTGALLGALMLVLCVCYVGAWAITGAVRLWRRWRVRRYAAEVAAEDRRALGLEAAATWHKAE